MYSLLWVRYYELYFTDEATEAQKSHFQWHIWDLNHVRAQLQCHQPLLSQCPNPRGSLFRIYAFSFIFTSIHCHHSRSGSHYGSCWWLQHWTQISTVTLPFASPSLTLLFIHYILRGFPLTIGRRWEASAGIQAPLYSVPTVCISHHSLPKPGPRQCKYPCNAWHSQKTLMWLLVQYVVLTHSRPS